MKLYELSKAYQDILNLIEGGEDVSDTLESLQEALEIKAENIAKVINSIDALSEIIHKEEKRLYERRKSLDSQAISLKSYLEKEMKNCNIQKIKGNLFTIAIQKNPPSVDVIDEQAIPEKYIKIITTTNIDKKMILEDLKNEYVINGVVLKQTESLRIR